MKKEKKSKSGGAMERDVAGVGWLIFYYLFLALGASNGPIHLDILSIGWWVFLLPLLFWIEIHIILAWITVKITEQEREDAHKRGEIYVDREEKRYQDWKLLHEEALREQEQAKS